MPVEFIVEFIDFVCMPFRFVCNIPNGNVRFFASKYTINIKCVATHEYMRDNLMLPICMYIGPPPLFELVKFKICTQTFGVYCVYCKQNWFKWRCYRWYYWITPPFMMAELYNNPSLCLLQASLYLVVAWLLPERLKWALLLLSIVSLPAKSYITLRDYILLWSHALK